MKSKCHTSSSHYIGLSNKLSKVATPSQLSFSFPDLLKYEGAAKDVFNIAMDLQIILSTVFKEDREDL